MSTRRSSGRAAGAGAGARSPRRASRATIARVRGLCLSLPDTSERVSHGEPTFFVAKRVFVMFADNHHDDGHVAVWVPAPPGVQEQLIASDPRTYFRPPYVGVRGWVGIELGRVSDSALAFHVQAAWDLVAPAKVRSLAAAADAAPPRAAARPRKRPAPTSRTRRAPSSRRSSP